MLTAVKRNDGTLYLPAHTIPTILNHTRDVKNCLPKVVENVIVGDSLVPRLKSLHRQGGGVVKLV